MIGAVTSNRSSRADSVPHTNTSAATIARSDALIAPPDASTSLFAGDAQVIEEAVGRASSIAAGSHVVAELRGSPAR
jgi:hypothetical protein